MAKSPWDYYPELTSDRLSVIAVALLDVFDDVQRSLSTDLDNSYTRGTTTFGRQKEKLIQLCRSSVYHWLDLRNTSNDLVCQIERVPFRFFSDDHAAPKKKSFWRRNAQDNLFPVSDDEPIYWRFVVESPLTDQDEASAYFIGCNANQELVCEWKYEHPVRTLRTTNNARPAEVATPAPEVSLPETTVEVRKDEESKS
jgi:hypothetical protein